MISSQDVKRLAASLGFDACGITRAEPLSEDEAKLKDWLREGKHGEMKYLENFGDRAKRFWESFPEAKSVIVMGVNYYSEARDRGSGIRGRVAKYAWGKDYHKVIGKRLEEFKIRLSEKAGREIRAETCVDTKPLLERSLAQKAGLGFIGKQSQLLSPKFGPWLFLAELVTDLELEADIPFIGSCGTCRICIDECPTEAIRLEGGIDARKCIAYLTIEHKSEIPDALRSLIGEWVFGCDICLEVCPFTSKAKETQWSEFKPESGVGEKLDLLKLLQIQTNGVYEKEFQGTAILRARRKQLLRNARVVLENLDEEKNKDRGRAFERVD
ncbi:MAG: tRNA epoxyqueuosine(34) reductase QueG [Candidatus Omnitrophica bacterium]|nr:tRNA epoxyqueuosine(34) reductase QueG [Candidatus Omnitrophota bacterium]